MKICLMSSHWLNLDRILSLIGCSLTVGLMRPPEKDKMLTNELKPFLSTVLQLSYFVGIILYKLRTNVYFFQDISWLCWLTLRKSVILSFPMELAVILADFVHHSTIVY